MEPRCANERVLGVYARELEAELSAAAGDCEGAVSALQRLLDDGLVEEADRGWYLREMARYNYLARRTESQRLQKIVYGKNRFLLKPREGVRVAKLEISHGRIEGIAAWVAKHENYEQLSVAVSDILSNLAFGVKADSFEAALDDLSRALGFVGERPDKEWKEGPDNLWAVEENRYLRWECKNEVKM